MLEEERTSKRRLHLLHKRQYLKEKDFNYEKYFLYVVGTAKKRTRL